MQHEAIEQAAASLGHTWRIRYYDEPATSAYTEDLSHRPVFLQMLADADAGLIDLVVVHRLDRFSRKQTVSMRVLQALLAAGIQFLSLKEQVDATSPHGQLVLGISGVVAEYDSTLKSERVAEGKLQRAKSGLPASRLPFGYRWNRAAGIPEPDAPPDAPPDTPHDGMTDTTPTDYSWPALQRLFQLALSGLDDDTVALRLNAEGYRQHTHSKLRNPDGTFDTNRLFTRPTIYAIRTNAFYRPFLPGDDRGAIPYLGEDYRGQHQAALDWDSWHLLQGLARNRRRGWPRLAAAVKPYTAEFRGLAVCAECHHRLDVVRSRLNAMGEHYEYYYCREGRRITRCSQHGLLARIEDVRAAWIAWVHEHLTLPDDWQDYIHERLEEEPPDEEGRPTPAQLHLEYARWTDERERAIDIYLKGWKDEAWANARIAEIDATLAALARSERPRPVQEARLLAAGHTLKNIAAAWEDEDVTTEQRIILATHLIAPGGLALTISGVQKRRNPRRPDRTLPPTCAITAIQLQPAFQEFMRFIAASA